jgi:hypothetical protein
LGNSVKILTFVKLKVYHCERFQSPAESTAGFSNALSYCPDLTMIACEQSENAINLAQLVGSENYSFIPIVRH